MQPEQLLASRVSNHLKMHHPDVIFRFDQIDQVSRSNGIKNKALHGKWSRGYPDLFIAYPTKKHSGFYIELKATTSLMNTEHTRRQSAFHELLRRAGYKVKYCFQYEDCIKKINKYLS